MEWNGMCAHLGEGDAVGPRGDAGVLHAVYVVQDDDEVEEVPQGEEEHRDDRDEHSVGARDLR